MPTDYLQKGESISEALNRLNLEDGLNLEIDMRRPHFETFQKWKEYLQTASEDKECCLIMKYEDIVKDDTLFLGKLADHYLFSESDRRLWVGLSKKYSNKNIKSKHIRNPAPKQWKDLFSEYNKKYFEYEFGSLIDWYESFEMDILQ